MLGSLYFWKNEKLMHNETSKHVFVKGLKKMMCANILLNIAKS
jgi:hypothetical protein